MEGAEVGLLVGECERDRHVCGGENGMTTGDGGSGERTERPEKQEIPWLRRRWDAKTEATNSQWRATRRWRRGDDEKIMATAGQWGSRVSLHSAFKRRC